MNLFVRRRIEFTVSDASSGSHSLHITGPDHRSIAHAVFVFQCTLENISNDLHIAVTMLGKPSTGCDKVFIDHAETTKAHVAWIVILIEGEGVIGIQPTMVEVTSLI